MGYQPSSSGAQSEISLSMVEVPMRRNGKINLVVNTPLGLIPRRDENGIRAEAVLAGVPVITTLGSAFAALDGIRSLREKDFSVKTLQEYSAEIHHAQGA